MGDQSKTTTILANLYKLELKQRNLYFKDALTWYRSIMLRYEKFGMNFSFPEFEPIIIYLEVYLDMLNINDSHMLYYQYIFIKQQLAQVKQWTICNTKQNADKTEMACDDWNILQQNAETNKTEICNNIPPPNYSIMNDTKCIGEYEIALNGQNYPYAYTLRVILNIMDFFEIWYRYSFKHNKDDTTKFLQNLHQKTEMSYCDGRIIDLNNTGYLDLRYRDDYYFYLEYLLENKQNRPFSLLFPSINKVGATEMQMLRSTPIHPIGISIIPVFADLSIMSQTNFVWHDINHARRNVQHNSYHFNNYKSMFDNNVNNYFTEMFIFQKKLLEKIRINKEDTDFIKNMKRWMKLIVFDTVHEDAMPYLPEVIIHNTLKPSNVCYPFESPNMVCGNNNIRMLRKFHGKGASTLAILFSKIRYEFYEKDTALDFILNAKYRTTYYLSIAVIELLRIILELSPHIKLKIPLKNIRSYIIKLINDKTNTETGILVPLKGLPDDSDQINSISEGSEEYEWIKNVNGGTFPNDRYSLGDYQNINYKQDYTSYTEINSNSMFWKSYIQPNLDAEFQYKSYVQNQNKSPINDIKIKDVKDISPKIDLTVLNKWRNMDTKENQTRQAVKGVDPDKTDVYPERIGVVTQGGTRNSKNKPRKSLKTRIKPVRRHSKRV
jgi:hypothetical protein